MLSLDTTPETHPSSESGTLEATELEKFYASAFVLHGIGIQHRNIKRTGPELQSEEQPQPRDISSIIKDLPANGKSERGQMGGNLLDSFALIFAKPGGKGVIATAMERSEDTPNIYVLSVARNGAWPNPRNQLDELAKRIETWFTNRIPHGSQERARGDHIDNPNIQNDLWKYILESCYSNISRHIKNARAGKTRGSGSNFSYAKTKTSIEEAAKPVSDKEGILEAQGILISIMEKLDMRSKPKENGNLKLLDTTTKLCYQLVESYREAMELIFSQLRAMLESQSSKDGDKRLIVEPGTIWSVSKSTMTRQL
ncbi:hypothetical protein F4677DRAFT_460624 [Hypoxylon crocopeplum]|nr:hypothetical protein F4677DRAFT_460624 [Hypoxylon crocopeplum]